MRNPVKAPGAKTNSSAGGSPHGGLCRRGVAAWRRSTNYFGNSGASGKSESKRRARSPARVRRASEALDAPEYIPAMYCLWIVPEEPEQFLLRDLIGQASIAGGGPRFDPHVTILSGIRLEASEILDRIAPEFERLPPFKLTLNSTGTGDFFFKSLFLVPQPSFDLGHLRRRAEEALKANSDSSLFDPHLSLAYGNSSAAAIKQMLAMAERKLPIAVRFERALVVQASSVIPVEEWHPINSIEFKGTSSGNSR